MRKGRDGEKNEGKKGKKMIIVVSTTSLPAVDRPNAHRWTPIIRQTNNGLFALITRFQTLVFIYSCETQPQLSQQPNSQLSHPTNQPPTNLTLNHHQGQQCLRNLELRLFHD